MWVIWRLVQLCVSACTIVRLYFWIWAKCRTSIWLGAKDSSRLSIHARRSSYGSLLRKPNSIIRIYSIGQPSVLTGSHEFQFP